MTPSELTHITEFRKTLHRFPEVSRKEVNTAHRVAEFLKHTRPTGVKEGLGGNGLMVTYDSGKPGGHIAFRAELDALPIPETNDFSYRSEYPGCAHLCGHDGHMAILAGLGFAIAQQPLPAGKVSLVFQPAEETGEGAGLLLDDARFQASDIDRIIACHNLPGLPAGCIAVRNGVFASASTGVVITLTGKSAHAASPASGVHPGPALSRLIQEFHDTSNPHTAHHAGSLITVVGARVGGPHFGTAPGDAELYLTVRAHTDAVISILVNEIRERAGIAAKRDNLTCDVSLSESFAATISDAATVHTIEQTARSLGMDVRHLEHPFAWSEDFGLFLTKIKGAYFGIGAGTAHPPLHTPNYDFPDDILPGAVHLLHAIAVHYTMPEA